MTVTDVGALSCSGDHHARMLPRLGLHERSRAPGALVERWSSSVPVGISYTATSSLPVAGSRPTRARYIESELHPKPCTSSSGRNCFHARTSVCVRMSQHTAARSGLGLL